MENFSESDLQKLEFPWNSHPFFDFADFFAKPGAQEDAEQAIREMQATAWGPRGNLISGTPHG